MFSIVRHILCKSVVKHETFVSFSILRRIHTCKIFKIKFIRVWLVEIFGNNLLNAYIVCVYISFYALHFMLINFFVFCFYRPVSKLYAFKVIRNVTQFWKWFFSLKFQHNLHKKKSWLICSIIFSFDLKLMALPKILDKGPIYDFKYQEYTNLSFLILCETKL